MFKFLATPFRAVNTPWVKYEADSEGVIIAPNKEIVDLFTAYGFKSLDEVKAPKQKKNETKNTPEVA